MASIHRYVAVICTLVLHSFSVAQLPTTHGTASPESFALGGIMTSLLSANPLGVIDNPALLGIGTTRLTLITGTLVPPTHDNTFPPHDPEQFETAIIIRTPISSFWSAMENVSGGIGYSRRSIEIPDFNKLSPGAEMIEGSPGTVDRLHFGIGYTGAWSISAGGTIKWVWEPSIPNSLPTNRRHMHAFDFAVGGLLPLLPVQEDSIRLPGRVHTGIDLSLGASWGDLGNDITGISGDEGFPERRVDLGLGIRFRINRTMANGSWELISMKLLREAEDDLLGRTPNRDGLSGPVVEQVGWMGQIQPFRNLIGGESSGDVIVREGLEIGLLELVSLRLGKEQSGEYDSPILGGFGLSSDGLFRLVNLFGGSNGLGPVNFALSHFGLRYDRAYAGNAEPYPRRVLSSLSIRVRI
jgi:hypothetical protein